MVEAHPDQATARRRLSLIGVVAASGMAAAALWFLVLKPEAQIPLALVMPPPPLESPESPEDASADVVEAPLPPPPPPMPEVPHDAAALPPAEVLGNLECRMVTGRRAASDLAAVILPHEAGARFSVVDGNGAVVGGTLPFMPNHYRIGRQEDGTPLIGLGALRLNSLTSRPVDSPEPLRIYLGEHVVYETDKAWGFLVAHDASSYVVHEPLGNDASRLVVRNLERGTEQHFDLGTRMTPTNAYEGGPSLSYALDNTEIKLYLSQSDAQGNGTYWFYPVSGGPARLIEVEGHNGAVLVSSREGYFAGHREDMKPGESRNVWQIAKRRFDVATGTPKDVWSRRLNLGKYFDGTLFVSGNGKWLGVDGWDFQALNTENGDTVFRYPTVGHREQQLARLVDVVGADASAYDLGSLGGISFKGDSMMFYRTFGLRDCFTPPGEKYDDIRYRKCLREQRENGSFKAVYDIYDMNTITLDAPASFRSEIYLETSCMPGGAHLGGLQDDNGTLTYLRGAR